MIRSLARIFIENYDKINDPSVQSKYISLSGIVGLVLNIILFLTKLFAGLLTNSIAMISDSFNNLSDSLTSVVAIIGSVASRKPADEDHPYGHGRLEYIASLIVGVLIMYMGIQLFIGGIEEIVNPTETNFSIGFVAVLLISNLIKIYMYYYNKKLSVKLNSSLNEGVAMDSLSDTIATTAILVTGIISYFTGLRLDGITGVLIAALVFKTGLDFFVATTSILLGEEASEENLDNIAREIMAGQYIKGYHDLYFHDYGRGTLVAHAHVEVPEDITVGQMHPIIDEIENNVKKKYGVDLVLHMDPRYELSIMDENSYTQIIDMMKTDDPQGATSQAADLIRQGEIVVIPTETVYGLAGDGLNPQAVEKIFDAKERPANNPLILHIDSIDMAEDLAVNISDEAYRLMEEFWPGPLTIVLEKSALVPDIVTAGGNSVGLRMPDNQTIREVIKKSDRPLACPSANISGRPSPTNLIDVYEDMKGKVKLILAEGSSQLGIESTIIDMTSEPNVLRLGYYDLDSLRKHLPKLSFDKDRSPIYKRAQDKSHYQTRADIFVYSLDLKNQIGKMQEDVWDYQDQGLRVGVLVANENVNKIKADQLLTYGSLSDKGEIARLLFSKLRDLDRLEVDIILVQAIDEGGMGKAIMNRIIKAADGKVVKE